MSSLKLEGWNVKFNKGFKTYKSSLGPMASGVKLKGWTCNNLYKLQTCISCQVATVAKIIRIAMAKDWTRDLLITI